MSLIRDNKLTSRIARRLRTFADRIDHYGAPKHMGYSFTFEAGKGLVFHEDGRRGCPLWYYGNDDYDRAHSEAEVSLGDYLMGWRHV